MTRDRANEIREGERALQDRRERALDAQRQELQIARARERERARDQRARDDRGKR
jgi:hypothetical protein